MARLGASLGNALTRATSAVNRRRYALTPEQWASFHEQGYLVLPAFFSADDMRAAREGLDELWAQRAATPLVIDVFDELGEDGTTGASERVRFATTPDSARERVYKLNDAYLERPWVRDLSLHPRLAAILGQLLDDAPVICNSLLFERGSTQPLHFDTYYMPGQTPGGMTATWIALEDAHADAGPLRYYPGSQRIAAWRNGAGTTLVRDNVELDQATHYIEAALRDYGLREESFIAREGDVFIWHEQLYHGGGRINDAARTRRSLVTHYWRAREMAPGSIVRHRRSGGYFWARPHASA
ncbi:MAG TPA: phytanoyl-CoA dioxygenase family protein [Acidimicrobiales bacterium]|nr:phytanoyl-CoA dioxygenase family protein [Acidimicrobiales bacterium]